MNNDVCVSKECYERPAKIEAQDKYCKTKHLPNFTPSGGLCWHCGKNIYDSITLEQAGSELISGCPVCHYSFCE